MQKRHLTKARLHSIMYYDEGSLPNINVERDNPSAYIIPKLSYMKLPEAPKKKILTIIA